LDGAGGNGKEIPERRGLEDGGVGFGGDENASADGDPTGDRGGGTRVEGDVAEFLEDEEIDGFVVGPATGEVPGFDADGDRFTAFRGPAELAAPSVGGLRDSGAALDDNKEDIVLVDPDTRRAPDFDGPIEGAGEELDDDFAGFGPEGDGDIDAFSARGTEGDPGFGGGAGAAGGADTEKAADFAIATPVEPDGDGGPCAETDGGVPADAGFEEEGVALLWLLCDGKRREDKETCQETGQSPAGMSSCDGSLTFHGEVLYHEGTKREEIQQTEQREQNP